jgi:hypothetical protein
MESSNFHILVTRETGPQANRGRQLALRAGVPTPHTLGLSRFSLIDQQIFTSIARSPGRVAIERSPSLLILLSS